MMQVVGDGKAFQDALNAVQGNTLQNLLGLWISNIRGNLPRLVSTESKDITSLQRLGHGKRAIVVGRGPSLFKHKHLEMLAKSDYDGFVIASDGALIDCLKAGVKVWGSLTVDGNREKIWKWFNFPLRGVRTVLPITVDPKAYSVAKNRGGIPYWYMPNMELEDNPKVSFAMTLATLFAKEEGKIMPVLATGGNCLPGDSYVFTKEGPKPIREIAVGDNVVSLHEIGCTTQTQMAVAPAGRSRIIPHTSYNIQEAVSFSRVSGKLSKGVNTVFELRTHTRRIKATAGHPFLVVSRNRIGARNLFSFDFQWKKLDEIRPGSNIVILSNMPESVDPALDNIKPDLMRLLGLYVGDGWNRPEHCELNFAIPASQHELREKYLEIIRGLFGPTISIGQDKDDFHVHSKAVSALVDELGFRGKALTKEVPAWVFHAPVPQILAFLEGYFDSDGTEYETGWRFETPNRRLLEQVRHLFMIARIRVGSIRTRTRRPKRIWNGYKWYNYGPTVNSGFSAYPNSTKKSQMLTESKTKVSKLPFRYLGLERVESIKEVGEEEVFDIEVEGSHNFVADGVVVHNSGMAAWSFAASALEVDEICLIGMDMGYPPDTKLEDLHYHKTMMRSVGASEELANSTTSYLKPENLPVDTKAANYYGLYKYPLTGEAVVVDPVFSVYRSCALSMIKQKASKSTGNERVCKTINATEGGSLFAEDGGIPLVKFADYLAK